jgi:carbonic anhydrase/acetyltransferase-like protein (isoleucine patch superfamily)
LIIVSFGGKTPKVANSALVADTAYLIGDVEIGDNTSIWPGAIIRGDMAPIRVGSNCHIEDNAVLHGAASVGDNSMVGHRCVIEGKIGANTMIAIGASVLLDAIIGDLCLVAADAVVLENMNIPDRSFVAGVPATIKGEVTQSHIDLMDYFLSYYVGLVRQYKEQGIWRR